MLNRPRNGTRSKLVVRATLTALLGMALGCGSSSPAGPTPTPPAPAPVASLAVYTVIADTSTVDPGGELSVSWSSSSLGHNDWIALFKKGDRNTAQAWWARWTDGAASGTFPLIAPILAGEYEFRYLVDDSYSDVARSGVVTVVPGAAPAH